MIAVSCEAPRMRSVLDDSCQATGTGCETTRWRRQRVRCVWSPTGPLRRRNLGYRGTAGDDVTTADNQ